MMIDKTVQFIFECRNLLFAKSLSILRTYGRNIGVACPTTLSKSDLIDEIISILSNSKEAILPSGRGAPVLDNRVDDKLVEEVHDLMLKYGLVELPPVVKVEEEPKAWKFSFDELFGPAKVSRSDRDSINKDRGDTNRIRFTGQLTTLKGVTYLLPLNCRENMKVPVTISTIQTYGLRKGDVLNCFIEKQGDGYSISGIDTINGYSCENFKRKQDFEEKDVCLPIRKINTYAEAYNSVANKFMDWVVPFGRGHRALLSSPPKTGKTQFLHAVAESASALNTNLTTLVLLIDQSPEVVGQFRKVLPKETFAFSTYEDEPEYQVFIAEYFLDRAKRLSECGQDVLLIVDSFNALAHAFNEIDLSAGGKMLPCGLESKTIHYIKKFFGAARCFAGGGSLTILGAASNETGNPADDVIMSELDSICNLEIYLKEEMSMRHLYPAITASSVYAKYHASMRYFDPTILIKLHADKFMNADITTLYTLLSTSKNEDEFLNVILNS